MKILTHFNLLFLFGIISLLSPSQASTLDYPSGTWASEDESIHLRLKPCGTALCGHIVWLRHPFDDKGCPTPDQHNIHEDQQRRNLMGLEILSGFQVSPGQQQTWTGGQAYDLSTGKISLATLTFDQDHRLHIQHESGTQSTWRHIPEESPHCPTDQVYSPEDKPLFPSSETKTDAATTQNPVGLWVVESGGARIQVRPCGEKYCGSIVWLRDPFNNQACQVRGKGQQKIMGTEIIKDFEREAKKENLWTGKLYDPESGRTYQGTLRLKTKDQLLVRGYLGIPLLGKTKTWTRFDSEQMNCPATPS